MINKSTLYLITRIQRHLTRTFIFTVAFLLMELTLKAQVKVTGSISDSKNKTPIIGAAVQAEKLKDSTIKTDAITDIDGTFELALPSTGDYKIKIFAIEYIRFQKVVSISQSPADLGALYIDRSGAVQLNTVVIKENQVRAVQKGDTTEMHADAYKTNTDATVQDLVSKMPGVSVDPNSGAVTAHGENVGRVLVDGKAYFGDDVTIAMKNLPADMVDKVQVFDMMSDQSRFTGFDDGNSVKTLNFITKNGMNKTDFGKIYGGYGTDNRYSEGFSINDFHGNRRISFLGLFNNINQQNFSAQDLLGVMNGSAGGGRRGGPGGGGNSSFLVGQQSGITTTNSAGFNYTDVWGKKIMVTGSYFFNSGNIVNTSTDNRMYFNKTLYNEYDTSHNINYNHRATIKLEYSINPNNSLLLNPTFTYQKNQNNISYPGAFMDSIGAPQSSTQNTYSSNSHGYNFSNTALFRHKFSKQGRTISLNVDNSFSDKSILADQSSSTTTYLFQGGVEKTINTNVNQQVPNISTGYSVKPTLTYTEPINKYSMASVNYAILYSQNNSDKKTYNYNDTIRDYTHLDTALSNNYRSIYTANIAGLGYRIRSKNSKLNFMASVNYQHAVLQGEQALPSNLSITKSFDNVLPSAVFMYKVSDGNVLRIFYRTSTSTPSISQLQNVIDNSNPLQLNEGNPNLKQSYTHTLFTRFGLTKSAKARTLFVFLFGSYTQNYIGNSTYIAAHDSTLPGDVILHKGSQIISPENMSGNYTFRSNITYSTPVNFIKSNLNLNNGFTFSRIPGMLNYQDENTNTYTFSQSVTISSNISKEVDFTLSYTASYNIVNNNLQTSKNNNYFNHLAVARLNWIIWKGFFVNTEADQSLYSTATSSSYNQHFILWNASIGKKFLKKQNADIRLTSFDLLNQNIGITRNVTDSYVDNIRSQVLHRYFLLVFTYNLKGQPPASLQRPDGMPHNH